MYSYSQRNTKQYGQLKKIFTEDLLESKQEADRLNKKRRFLPDPVLKKRPIPWGADYNGFEFNTKYGIPFDDSAALVLSKYLQKEEWDDITIFQLSDMPSLSKKGLCALLNSLKNKTELYFFNLQRINCVTDAEIVKFSNILTTCPAMKTIWLGGLPLVEVAGITILAEVVLAIAEQENQLIQVDFCQDMPKDVLETYLNLFNTSINQIQDIEFEGHSKR